MKSTFPTVTVGIPAYNEAGTILSVLESLLQQQQTNFKLQQIVVASDGGTDHTIDVVKRFAVTHPIVSYLDDGKNKGKIARLNQLYAGNTSDILVTIDADTVIQDRKMLSKLVPAFDTDTVGLVGGNDKPLPEPGFFQQIVATSIELWYETRKDIHGGDSIHNHHGCLSAVSKSFAKSLVIPAAAVSDDEYLYLAAKQQGFQFRFVQAAVLYYRVPGSLRDYLMQSARFIGTEQHIGALFGPSISAEYDVPRANKIRAIGIMLKRKPILTMVAMLLQITVRIVMPYFASSYANGNWTRVDSTKKTTV